MGGDGSAARLRWQRRGEGKLAVHVMRRSVAEIGARPGDPPSRSWASREGQRRVASVGQIFVLGSRAPRRLVLDRTRPYLRAPLVGFCTPDLVLARRFLEAIVDSARIVSAPALCRFRGRLRADGLANRDPRTWPKDKRRGPKGMRRAQGHGVAGAKVVRPDKLVTALA